MRFVIISPAHHCRSCMNSDPLIQEKLTTMYRTEPGAGSVISPGIQLFLPISCYAPSGIASEGVRPSRTHVWEFMSDRCCKTFAKVGGRWWKSGDMLSTLSESIDSTHSPEISSKYISQCHNILPTITIKIHFIMGQKRYRLD
jgi:hypothetical protein